MNELGFSKNILAYAKVGKGGLFQITPIQQDDENVQKKSSVSDRNSRYKGMTLTSINPEKLNLFDESVFGTRFIASDIYYDGLNTKNENCTIQKYEDVQKVLKKIDGSECNCSTCNFYITKRDVLPRKAISPDFDEVFTGEVSLQMPEDTPFLEHQSSFRVDVIKAIVYGGLLESIASLCVIVSAAGGDATTLNIVALGLANVFGGLLALGNSLLTLKELSGLQYEDQLGQPRHFLIHSLIAIISYLVFGLISPLIYGFSFYDTDSKNLKLATLAFTSLVCITVLSIGKAYVQRPPKAYLRTIYYYISLAVTVSGIAYVTGDLISFLLKKLRVFEFGMSVSISNQPWSSY